MLKFVQCIKGQPDIELYEFRQYWSDYCTSFGSFLQRHGNIRVDFSTALAVEDNLRVMVERGTRPPYDGMVEVYFENAGILQTLLNNPEFQEGLEKIQALQNEFIDLEQSTFFFAMDDE
jgi:hypothetical protein